MWFPSCYCGRPVNTPHQCPIVLSDHPAAGSDRLLKTGTRKSSSSPGRCNRRPAGHRCYLERSGRWKERSKKERRQSKPRRSVSSYSQMPERSVRASAHCGRPQNDLSLRSHSECSAFPLRFKADQLLQNLNDDAARPRRRSCSIQSTIRKIPRLRCITRRRASVARSARCRALTR